VTRNPVEDLDLVEADAPGNAKDAPKTAGLKGHSDSLTGQNDPIADLLNKIQEWPNADYASLARDLRGSEATVKRNIQKLKQQNRLRRVGSKKTGHWEIIE
jgi:ATP-dependent DNA helicase RecG